MKEKGLPSWKKIQRKSGVLVHPTSFPGPYGIGDLGPSAYYFINFLEETGQQLWQVLPLGPTGYGDSPYQSFSSFAGQPLIISIDQLMEWKLIEPVDVAPREWEAVCINYGELIPYKYEILRKAYANFKALPEKEDLKLAYAAFVKEQKNWLENYATFMAVKDYHDGVMWTQWAADIAFPTKDSLRKWQDKLRDEIGFYQFLQFAFFKQWFELKEYANQKGIQIVGDIPIFVAFDSADVWANKDLFMLDTKGYPTRVAGVPPDYFSATGQLWGNPLYDWKKHKAEGYRWWVARVSQNLKMYDYLRIDHFRGFAEFWAIPYGNKTAIEGEWLPGPGADLFRAFQKELGEEIPIIAEDLGLITPDVEELRDAFQLPGMKILQFGFENIEENGDLPHYYPRNSICYTGTHDNDTTLGWYEKLPEVSKDKIRRYLNTDANTICWDFIRLCFGSVSKMAIVPLQDILSFGSFSRMNTPGVEAGNWQWRYTAEMLSPHIRGQLSYVTKLYGRVRLPEEEQA